MNALENANAPIEGYCVRCKASVVMDEPQPVWTSRGTPGARGICPECGGAVFRMGSTPMHDGLERPKPITVQKSARRAKPKLPPETLYMNYAPEDESTAQQIADDFHKVGLTVWLHDATPEEVNWAGGVHPALKDCARMVVLLSADCLRHAHTRQAWGFFKQKGKPIVIAQLDATPPPDELRRSARFDFGTTGDYRSAFRQMLQALER